MDAPRAPSRSSSQSPGCAAEPPERIVSPVMAPRPSFSEGTQAVLDLKYATPVTVGRSWFSSR